jgi:uncharacterized protein YbcI
MDQAEPPGSANAGEGQPASQQNLMSTISNEMVRIYKDQFGRGPTKTRANWSGPDTIVVTLEDTFTPAERRLSEMGEHQRLRDLRLLFQYAEVARFCDPVERLTGRRVKAFISGMDTVADVATELFVLHPAGSDAPSRAST